MKQFNPQTIPLLVALVCLSAVGCSATRDKIPAANSGAQVNPQARPGIVLADGVYPVVLADELIPKGIPKTEIVELIDVPVEDSEDSIREKIRVIARPLLRFRKVSHFDFTFEHSECTEVGFQNTDELKAYTRAHVGSRLAVVIGNKVISHHKIREAIEADQVRITCCTVGGGEHLHKQLKQLKLTSKATDGPK